MFLASYDALSAPQKALLRRGKISTVSDLILAPAQDVAKKCRVSPLEIKAIVDIVCESNPIQARKLAYPLSAPNWHGTCTSGDPILDVALGGGFRTGMIWEIVGESAAGKTQLALRASLLAQLSEEHGGLGGSACYLVTSGKLPTARLLQISQHHSLLASSEECHLGNIHTMPVPSIEFLTEALSKLLPVFVEGKLKQHNLDPTTKLVRLVVIDALGELFHSSSKTSTQTLMERSKNITEISSHLHSIASKFGIVILVLNEVVDAFDRGSGNSEDPALGLPYAEQSRWFGRAHSVPGEERKEASLGLVWANQVNARIMLSRTGRRRYLSPGQSEKRQKMNGPNNLGQPSKDSDHLELIRRMSIVFSSVSAPRSLDYIVDAAGITVLAEEEWDVSNIRRGAEVSTGGQAASEPAALQSVNLDITIPSSQIAPLDVGSVEIAGSELSAEPSRAPDDEDGWDVFWEKDQITEEMYLAADLSLQ